MPLQIESLFETHLPVADLERSMHFYGSTLGLSLAQYVPDRHVAFYWLGTAQQSMLGLWWQGYGPHTTSLHIAFRVTLDHLPIAHASLRSAGIEPLDFYGHPCDEPNVLGWMPAAAIYFRDPDGHLLEYISILDEQPRPELGVVSWSEWRSSTNRHRIGRA